MTLKATVDSLDDVPAELRSYYSEANGTYSLVVDGMAPKAKIDEFRDRNVELLKTVDEYKTRYDGVDPDKFRELSDKAQKERERRLLDQGKTEEMFAERTKAMTAEHEKVVKAIAAEKASMQAQLENLLITDAIRSSAAQVGVRATAVEDVLHRGKAVFKLRNGKPVPLDEHGNAVYGKSGEIMTVGEFVAGLADSAPHLFEASQGGGSRNSTTSVPGTNRIARGDSRAILDNLAAIASNRITVS